jgi:uncharacterized protein
MPSIASAADKARHTQAHMERLTPRTPTLAECLQLMEQYGMLANIRRHSLVVARLAERLLDGLGDSLPPAALADRQLVIAGALLHDIAKTPCLNSACDHARMGAGICREHGFEEVAAIVEEHVILRQYEPDRYQAGSFSAREIVYYADKRVRHHQVVSLEERLDYILDHYGRDNSARRQLIRENFTRCLTLERLLFQWLPFHPEDL